MDTWQPHEHDGEELGEGLGRVLTSGACDELEHLEVRFLYLRQEGIEAVEDRALRIGRGWWQSLVVEGDGKRGEASE